MAGIMQKLNPMGVPSQVKSTANVKPIQVVNVTYGHNGSGKLYSYYGQNKRTGDIVTPKVTHPSSGKTYKTLATVRSTHNINNANDTMRFLHNKDIAIKPIGKTDQKSLPGYYQGWDKDAKAAQELKHETLARNDIPQMQKMSLLNEVRQMRNNDITKNMKK